MNITISQKLTAVADLFLPRLCCVCGDELGMMERDICLGCLSQLPLTYNWKRPQNPMADRFNTLIADGDAAKPVPYSYAVALFNFSKEGGFRHITYRLKYGRDIALGRHFASMLGEKIAGEEHLRDIDTVIPVPLHWTRRLKRGYNQAEVIAKEIASKTGAALRTDILRRGRITRTQTKLGVEEKKRNVRGAFVLRERALEGFPGPSAQFDQSSLTPGFTEQNERQSSPKTPSPRHILLVDDVFTTGSTLYNCYLPLREALGDEVRISVATLGVV